MWFSILTYHKYLQSMGALVFWSQMCETGTSQSTDISGVKMTEDRGEQRLFNGLVSVRITSQGLRYAFRHTGIWGFPTSRVIYRHTGWHQSWPESHTASRTSLWWRRPLSVCGGWTKLPGSRGQLATPFVLWLFVVYVHCMWYFVNLEHFHTTTPWIVNMSPVHLFSSFSVLLPQGTLLPYTKLFLSSCHMYMHDLCIYVTFRNHGWQNTLSVSVWDWLSLPTMTISSCIHFPANVMTACFLLAESHLSSVSLSVSLSAPLLPDT